MEDALNKLKRKFDRQKQYTPRPSANPTKVMDLEELHDDEEIAQLRAKMRADRPAFPALQAATLLVGLAGVIALWLWLRQPPSAESLKSQISSFMKENDWSRPSEA